MLFAVESGIVVSSHVEQNQKAQRFRPRFTVHEDGVKSEIHGHDIFV